MKMTVLRPAAWAGVLCVSLSVAPIGARVMVQDPPVELTKAVRKALDTTFPGWALVPPPACVSASTPASADINFDLLPDLGLVITTASGETRLVVVMPRSVGRPVVHDLGLASSTAGATHVTVLPTGRPFRRPAAMFDDYLSGPTFAAASCSRPLAAFLWTGYGFRAVPL